jgi:CRP/FNR family transcriptional regulator, cyclic AMP receptor protein
VATADILGTVPLFSCLSKRDLSRLAKATHEHTYEPGTQVTTQGKSGVGFFVILEGKARVQVQGRRAKLLGPGDYFGEMALIDDAPRSAHVTAETELRCQVLTQWQFRPFVKEHPEIAWALLKAMVARVRETQTES